MSVVSLRPWQYMVYVVVPLIIITVIIVVVCIKKCRKLCAWCKCPACCCCCNNLNATTNTEDTSIIEYEMSRRDRKNNWNRHFILNYACVFCTVCFSYTMYYSFHFFLFFFQMLSCVVLLCLFCKFKRNKNIVPKNAKQRKKNRDINIANILPTRLRRRWMLINKYCFFQCVEAQILFKANINCI